MLIHGDQDIDFSQGGIGMRRTAGYEATMRVLGRAAWQGEFDPIEGIILHKSMPRSSDRGETNRDPTREGPKPT
jgi:hypothetical protein